jgi:hypothetical protein
LSDASGGSGASGPAGVASDAAVTPLPLDASFAADPSVSPPDLASAGDVALVTFGAFGGNGARAMLACFSSPLDHGFSEDEIAPLVIDKVRDVAVKKMQFTHVAAGPITREQGGLVLRRADAAGAGVVVSDLAFTADARVIACAAACSDDAACGAAARSTRFSGALVPQPGPGVLLSIALSAVHHPDAAIALGVGFALAVSALLVWRRPRSPFRRRRASSS